MNHLGSQVSLFLIVIATSFVSLLVGIAIDHQISDNRLLTVVATPTVEMPVPEKEEGIEKEEISIVTEYNNENYGYSFDIPHGFEIVAVENPIHIVTTDPPARRYTIEITNLLGQSFEDYIRELYGVKSLEDLLQLEYTGSQGIVKNEEISTKNADWLKVIAPGMAEGTIHHYTLIEHTYGNAILDVSTQREDNLNEDLFKILSSFSYIKNYQRPYLPGDILPPTQ